LQTSLGVKAWKGQVIGGLDLLHDDALSLRAPHTAGNKGNILPVHA
jgi:hypothetical protein